MDILQPHFTWSPVHEDQTSSSYTTGTFTITLDSDPLWGNETFEWSWVSLLEWLNQTWDILQAPTYTPGYYHNLAQGVNGASLPELTLWRTETEGHVLTNSQEISLPLNEWENFIQTLGDQIAQRLMWCGDERARLLLKEWATR